ncbi:hypothetical protein NC651_009916 [Populus alba x Populus x berolinensis]|nr:hypothetical protein NC651_009916 [Populus alba x Populus x berolinensis]
MAYRDKKPAKPSSSGAGSIRTLSDLDRWTGPESDSDDEDAPEYGMLVQDPTKGNDVDAIFNQARQLGAVEGETVPSAPQQPEAVVHNIVFWTKGFTVDDGPLRRLDDPENASFLEVIATLVENEIKVFFRRLADGTRMVAHFNNSRTVNDIGSSIDASRPGGARNYQLQLMGFPPNSEAPYLSNSENRAGRPFQFSCYSEIVAKLHEGRTLSLVVIELSLVVS